jgi:hypothetical protein
LTESCFWKMGLSYVTEFLKISKLENGVKMEKLDSISLNRCGMCHKVKVAIVWRDNNPKTIEMDRCDDLSYTYWISYKEIAGVVLIWGEDEVIGE